MTTLLIAEHDSRSVSKQTSHALSAALEMGGPVHLLVAGHDSSQAATGASRLGGILKVLHADHPVLAHQLAEPLAELIVGLAPEYDAIVGPSTTTIRSVLPRVAALLDVMQVSDVTRVLGPDLFERPTYAGNAIETVRARDAKKVLTIRTTAFPAAAEASVPVSIQAIAPPAICSAAEFVGEVSATQTRPELASAKVVVSGGRALGSREGFEKLIFPLADKLGAAIGASRAAVDAGFAPNDWQVGQTGKIVAPSLYVAIGISGAIQHLAGMKDSKVIVAINKDPEAPIFQVADFGLVGDIFDIIPEMVRVLDA